MKKYRRKDGRLIWVSNNVSLVAGTERVPRFVMALSEDITKRKRAEDALRASEAPLLDAQRLTRTCSWRHEVLSGKVTLSAEGLPVFGNPTMTHRRLLSIRKGAFTEALQRRLGRFELANGGTIVLAENRQLPLDTQVGLLRVLQEREFERRN